MGLRVLFLVFFAWVVVALPATAQLTLVIDQYPSYTPQEDSLFLTGTFNEWMPRDTRYVFQKQANGTLTYTFPVLPAEFRYKVTRGSWPRVEGSVIAQSIGDRVYTPRGQARDTVFLQIQSWEDMTDHLSYRAELTFRVTSLPENTPPDASIYLVGNFNNWHPGDSRYKMERQVDGTYTVQCKIFKDSIFYKFTRGNWQTAEGRPSGRARQNRLFVYQLQQSGTLVDCKIDTWEDLSGGVLNILTFLLLLAGFQGILLIIAINTIQNNNKSANRILSLLILLISVALIGRVSTYDREIFQWIPKLLLLPDLIYFLFAPIFLVYMQKLLTVPSSRTTQRWLHFIPAVLQLLAYLPLILMDNDVFVSRVVDQSLKPFFAAAGGMALIYNAFYLIKGYQLVRAYEDNTNANYSFEQNIIYLHTIIQLIAICIGVWLLTYLVGIIGMLTNHELSWITDKSTDAVWVIFALLIFCLGYFAMKQPEIFKIPEEHIEEHQPHPPVLQEHRPPTPTEDFSEMMEQLTRVMEQQQPFLNPKLTLADLAQLVPTNVHTLSRVINEGFNKNFYDFINSYRVEAFKDRVVQEEYKNQTFLAIALSVGFNSKTAFNRSFKKLTNSTPRQYFKDR